MEVFMKNKLLILSAIASLFSSSVAYARPHDHHDRGWHRGHERYHDRYKKHDYHRSRNVVSFNFGNSGWHDPYPQRYVTRTRYIYAQPVIVQQNVQTLSDDRYCREYQTTSRIGGRWRPTYGTACYRPDGSWEVTED